MIPVFVVDEDSSHVDTLVDDKGCRQIGLQSATYRGYDLTTTSVKTILLGMKTTIESLNINYKNAVNDMIARHGDISLVPRDERDLLAERYRASVILAMNEGADVAKTLRFYSVLNSVIAEFVSEDAIAAERRVKRADKYQAVIDWCHDHPYEQVSANQVAEIGGVSYPTALKFIGDRVDLFKKVKRGVYEVRNVKEERAAVK